MVHPAPVGNTKINATMRRGMPENLLLELVLLGGSGLLFTLWTCGYFV